MNLLLDTRVLIWCFENNKRLKDSVRELLTEGDNNIFVSAVSTWELSMKAALGKITMPEDFEVQRDPGNFSYQLHTSSLWVSESPRKKIDTS